MFLSARGDSLLLKVDVVEPHLSLRTTAVLYVLGLPPPVDYIEDLVVEG